MLATEPPDINTRFPIQLFRCGDSAKHTGQRRLLIDQFQQRGCAAAR
jgi:hypothetical protein